MDLLRRYSNLGPFTIDELVSAVNSVLRDRPDLAISKRTIRFYVSQGIIPPPRGAPKFARYPFENLLTIVAIRRLQDQGDKLEIAQKRAIQVRTNDLDEAIRWVESLGRQTRQQSQETQPAFAASEMAPAPRVAEQAVMYSMSPHEPASPQRRNVSLERYELGPDISLTVPSDRNQREALIAAKRAIEEILRDSHDTT